MRSDNVSARPLSSRKETLSSFWLELSHMRWEVRDRRCHPKALEDWHVDVHDHDLRLHNPNHRPRNQIHQKTRRTVVACGICSKLRYQKVSQGLTSEKE